MNIGTISIERDKLLSNPKEAIQYCQERSSEALAVLAETHGKYRNFNEAIKIAKLSIEINPENWFVWNNLASIYYVAELYDEALKCSDKALEYVRGTHYDPYFLRGVICVSMRKLEEAEKSYRRAIDFSSPNVLIIKYNLGCCLMLMGKKEGLKYCELRLSIFKSITDFLKHLNKPFWDGSDLTGKNILVFCEQGIGDAVQHLRFVPELRNKNPNNVYLEVQEELAKVCENTGYFDGVFSRNSQRYPDLPQHDVMVSITSLGYYFENSQPVPYIKSEGKYQLYSDKIKVGICFSGSPRHDLDRNRTIPLSKFKKLCHQDIQMYIFNKDNPVRQWYGEVNILDETDHVVDLSDNIKNFNDTLCYMNEMNLIISIDSSVCHLAGAAGKKVWVMLPKICDARWLVSGDKTKWYPTMKLFRQTHYDQWDEVFDNVFAALKQEFSLKP